jgi:hypothetical protein
MADRMKRFAEPLPGILGAVLPSVTCPACWPAYAGVLSSLGIGVVLTGPYFLIAVGALLGITLFALGFRCRSRRGFGPLAMGAVASVVILVAKFAGTDGAETYAAAGALIAASVWNNWPRRADRESTAGGTCDCGATQTRREDEDL